VVNSSLAVGSCWYR